MSSDIWSRWDAINPPSLKKSMKITAGEKMHRGSTLLLWSASLQITSVQRDSHQKYLKAKQHISGAGDHRSSCYWQTAHKRSRTVKSIKLGPSAASRSGKQRTHWSSMQGGSGQTLSLRQKEIEGEHQMSICHPRPTKPDVRRAKPSPTGLPQSILTSGNEFKKGRNSQFPYFLAQFK